MSVRSKRKIIRSIYGPINVDKNRLKIRTNEVIYRSLEKGDIFALSRHNGLDFGDIVRWKRRACPKEFGMTKSTPKEEREDQVYDGCVSQDHKTLGVMG